MDKVETIKKLRQWCSYQPDEDCDKCIFAADGTDAWCHKDSNWGNGYSEELFDEALKRIEALKEESTPVTEEHTSVNHPSHYNQEGAMECIDEMIMIFGREATMHFCLCNAWKYRYRANEKNGEEDMDKANWYIKKYKELSENG